MVIKNLVANPIVVSWACHVPVCLMSMTLCLLPTELTLGYWFTRQSAGWTREEQSTTPRVVLFRTMTSFWIDSDCWTIVRYETTTATRYTAEVVTITSWQLKDSHEIVHWLKRCFTLWVFEDTVYGCRSGTELSTDRLDWWNDSVSPSGWSRVHERWEMLMNQEM